jgi:hypothetical protein
MSAKPFYQRAVLEKDHEADGKAYAFRRGWMEVKLVSPSRRGWPDRFYARGGVIVLAEWKKPGEEPTAQQLKVHRELRAHGVTVHVFHTLEEAMEVLK